jgi:hypothetical protein
MTAADRGHAPPAVTRLPAEDIRRLDPYGFLAVLGKRVIRPGGRRSTQQLLELASLAAGQQVLDIGCRVATTIQVAQRFNAQVTAPTWPRSCWPAPTATPILPTAVRRCGPSKVTCPRCSPNSAPGIEPTSPPATWNGSDVKDGDAETACHQPESFQPRSSARSIGWAVAIPARHWLDGGCQCAQVPRSEVGYDPSGRMTRG